MTKPQQYPSYPFVHLMPYHKGDSLDALAHAVKNNVPAVDWNFHVTKDNIIVCTHWSQPLKHGWYDPKNLLKKDTLVWHMTWREVSRLRTKDGYRILTARTMLSAAAKAGIRVEFEAKDSPGFVGTNGVHIFTRVKSLAKKKNLKITVKTLSTLKGAPQRLSA